MYARFHADGVSYLYATGEFSITRDRTPCGASRLLAGGFFFLPGARGAALFLLNGRVHTLAWVVGGIRVALFLEIF